LRRRPRFCPRSTGIDLGYSVGYRIAKSYLHAADKRRAFRDILELTDPKLFRVRSGWYPGISLQ
jgi:hypothetical protein